MITVKYLKQRLEQYPDDAQVYAYEAEVTGIGIVDDLSSDFMNILGFIIASESNRDEAEVMEDKALAIGMNKDAWARLRQAVEVGDA